MLQYFNFPLVFAALFNVELFHYFAAILLLRYYFNIVPSRQKDILKVS